MFTLDRKPSPSSAHSPAPKSASQNPQKAPPMNPLWFGPATSSNARAAASPEMTEERRRYFEPLLPAPASAPWSRVERAGPEAEVETQAYPPVAPGPHFSFARIPVMTPVLLKATVSSPGDPYEREADEVADKVMRMPAPAGDGLQRKCAGCEEENKVQRKGDGGAVDGMAAPPIVDEVLRSPGQPLDAGARAFMEPRFGHDFSRVRIHTDARAARSAKAVNAHAYTVGNDIVFGSGTYAPQSQAGRSLLAHELTHTLQQSGDGVVEGGSSRARGDGQSRELLRRQPYPGDGMRPPGDCSLADYAVLWGSVETAKAVVNGLGGCRAGDDCLRLAFKIAAVSAEIAARIAMMVTCFRGGDTYHRGEVDRKNTMLNRCLQFFNGSNCSPELVAAMAVVVEQIRGLLAAAMVAAAVVVVAAMIAALIAAIIALLELIVAAAAAAAEAAAMAAAAAAIIALLVHLGGALGGGGPSEA